MKIRSFFSATAGAVFAERDLFRGNAREQYRDLGEVVLLGSF